MVGEPAGRGDHAANVSNSRCAIYPLEAACSERRGYRALPATSADRRPQPGA
jgi:hypothetical protein